MAVKGIALDQLAQSAVVLIGAKGRKDALKIKAAVFSGPSVLGRGRDPGYCE